MTLTLQKQDDNGVENGSVMFAASVWCELTARDEKAGCASRPCKVCQRTQNCEALQIIAAGDRG